MSIWEDLLSQGIFGRTIAQQQLQQYLQSVYGGGQQDLSSPQGAAALEAAQGRLGSATARALAPTGSNVWLSPETQMPKMGVRRQGGFLGMGGTQDPTIETPSTFPGGMQGMQAMAKILTNPDMQRIGMALLGEQGIGMSPLEQAQTGRLRQPEQPSVGDIEAQYLMGLPPERRNTVLEQKLTRPGVSVNIAGTERQQMAETEANLESLNDLSVLYDKLPEREKPGLLRGNISPYTGAIGRTSKEWEDFAAASANFNNYMIKEISGANVPVGEKERMYQQIPLTTDPPQRWKPKWTQSKLNLQRIQRARLKIMEKTGADVSKLKDIVNKPQRVEQMPLITSEAEYIALPIGVTFRDSSGNIGVKK